jgi:excisionase family DNA binding protein
MEDEIMRLIKSQFSEVFELLQRVVPDRSNHQPSKPPLTVSQAADFVCMAVPTIYGKVSRGEIPCYKRGKRLYFNEDELRQWIEAGRRKTTNEILKESSISMKLKAKLR